MTEYLRSIGYTVATIVKFVVCYTLAILVTAVILDRFYTLATFVTAFLVDRFCQTACALVSHLAEWTFEVCLEQPLC
jgi:hypothetical protein